MKKNRQLQGEKHKKNIIIVTQYSAVNAICVVIMIPIPAVNVTNYVVYNEYTTRNSNVSRLFKDMKVNVITDSIL